MELKNYQQEVLADLKAFLERLRVQPDIAKAFREHCAERNFPATSRAYHTFPSLSRIPVVCFKAPTGSGKTFMACHALRPIFDFLPSDQAQVVVWLMPSDAILTQTIRHLKDRRHPYRHAIDLAFQSRVAVYTKEELLLGQQFNPFTVREQLSILLLSYDSFRRQNKYAIKSRQENSNYLGFAKALGQPSHPLVNADRTSLFQIINQLRPVIVVDESHHAKTPLSIDMLSDFNPAFILELTATPRETSNIISIISSRQLKAEHMIKLPVVVYNRRTENNVINDAIALRRRLEEIAEQQEMFTGCHIRPIVLFQAEPKTGDDKTTFERLCKRLVGLGIKREEIAIRTADINELKQYSNLMARDCPIRYIITVNALKEGWDCPFAYILATVANRSSQIEVEQILGRILRLPYTREHADPALNMSYVLVSSSEFSTALWSVIHGLEHSGFTEDDCRVGENDEPLPEPSPQSQPLSPAEPASASEDAASDTPFDTAQSDTFHVNDMVAQARRRADEYHAASFPSSQGGAMPTYQIKPKYREAASAIRFPQFFFLSSDRLTPGLPILYDYCQSDKQFKLAGQQYNIPFVPARSEISLLDTNEEGTVTPGFAQGPDRLKYMEYLSGLNPDKRFKHCQRQVKHYLDGKFNNLSSSDLYEYVDRVISIMDEAALGLLQTDFQECGRQIEKFIRKLLHDFRCREFNRLLQTGQMVLQPHWQFPNVLKPSATSLPYDKSLYDVEGFLNPDEDYLLRAVLETDVIEWWHRNPDKKHPGSFYINGSRNHYPDFIFKTKKGTIVLVEAKGEHLTNEETIEKIQLGNLWAARAGEPFRYYMVFKDNIPIPTGASSVSAFLDVFQNL